MSIPAVPTRWTVFSPHEGQHNTLGYCLLPQVSSTPSILFVAWLVGQYPQKQTQTRTPLASEIVSLFASIISLYISTMETEVQNAPTPVHKSKKNRKDKPWDNDPTIDKWKMPQLKQEDVNGAFLEESSFAILFPSYREKYIQECYGLMKKKFMEFGIKCQLNLIEGSLTVRTTKKTWDPYSIIKARDAIKLISRSVPYQQALRLMDDGVFSDIIKIRSYVRNRQKFVKRRQRLIGPNGATLKALEILTQCYLLVQGSTVSLIGTFKDIKILRRIVIDTMLNVHPVYHIKELMLKRELMKDDKLKEENWDRFLPNFKQVREKKKRVKKQQRKQKKPYDPFPPAQLPRKIDIMMDTGEYFLGETEKKKKTVELRREKAAKKQEEKQAQQEKEYIPPTLEDQIKADKRQAKKNKMLQEETIEDIKDRFLREPNKKFKFGG